MVTTGRCAMSASGNGKRPIMRQQPFGLSQMSYGEYVEIVIDASPPYLLQYHMIGLSDGQPGAGGHDETTQVRRHAADPQRPGEGPRRFWKRLYNGRYAVVMFDGRDCYPKHYDSHDIVSFGSPGPDDQEMPAWAR